MCENQKVALVTGSSRGIGASLIESFAEQGYRVAVNYLRSERSALNLLDRLVSRHGCRAAIAVRADVACRDDVMAMFDEVYGQLGRADLLVNCAGINMDGPFLEMNDAQWSTVLGTILTGTFLCSQEFARRCAGRAGNIINIGAVTAIRGRKNGANYCSARAGVLALTKCLALELAPGIRVNCVTPGYINTDEVMERYQLHQEDNISRALSSIPLGRLGTPDDVFQTIEFLVRPSSYVTGQNFLIDGGYFMR